MFNLRDFMKHIGYLELILSNEFLIEMQNISGTHSKLQTTGIIDSILFHFFIAMLKSNQS